ncbi:plasmid mobilization relaxosome protein MobC [Pedobacter sp. ISL-68]|uniref:plasmid mobilization protein n=1 Tax=unclassified Pedobacter TaxID=2628915 RepID=UPI001BEC57EC|nr:MULTISPECIES: plasmid mobilization relaxosome protein MobC [unclassified Pedobacter]MBT2560114.1 plasmid mobilization relaxosome protein MobC [Pedobacter sp. ISL-64]MBT2589093.1 plasmid mobilization relaxosome protein MobC [Pedobacter sp. ISL-68]
MKDKIKFRGRPRLLEGKKIRKIDARFTEEEYRRILDLEKELGISRADLIRSRLLDNLPLIMVNAKEMIRELDEIGTEIGRAGNNINQLARYANILNKKGILSPAVTERFNLLFQDYITGQTALEITLRKIIRTLGR